MNQYYAMYGSEVKIIDENNNITTREITGNFQDILKKENEIEAIEYQLSLANESIADLKKSIKIWKKIKWLCSLVGFSFGLFISLLIAATKWDFSVFLSLVSFQTGLFFAFLGGSISCGLQLSIRNELKPDLQSAKLTSYFLEKEISLKQQELEILKEKSQKIEISEKQLGIEKVDDREILLKLREYLEQLEKYGKTLPKQANKYARGFWNEEDREKVQNDGINAGLFESYLDEYNTRKLLKGKRAS